MTKRKWTTLVALAPLTALLVAIGNRFHDICSEPSFTVFAASSTGLAMEELVDRYERKCGVRIELNTASSSTLARQIEAGAVCDIYLSANILWMDFLQRHGLLDEATRKELLRNRLVMIASRDFTPTHPQDSACRIAMGNPAHVPAGMYAKEALQNLGIYEQVEDRIIPMPNVTATLKLVESGEAKLGFVYASDASAAKVQVVDNIRLSTGTPISYPVSCTQNANKEARAFMQFLLTLEAREVFSRHGFSHPEPMIAQSTE